MRDFVKKKRVCKQRTEIDGESGEKWAHFKQTKEQNVFSVDGFF
jgi:hypothetical protein